MFRENADGSEFWIRRVAAHRIAAHLEGGWLLLISEAQVRTVDLEDTYRADTDRPFNPPRTL